MVKIITGSRRSGKSFLLFNIYKDYLLKNITDENHIIEFKKIIVTKYSSEKSYDEEGVFMYIFLNFC